MSVMKERHKWHFSLTVELPTAVPEGERDQDVFRNERKERISQLS